MHEQNFACESFANVPDLRQIVQQEAQERIKRDKVLHISGFDINKDAIKLALKHAERAGVKDKIHLQAGDMREVSSAFFARSYSDKSALRRKTYG